MTEEELFTKQIETFKTFCKNNRLRLKEAGDGLPVARAIGKFKTDQFFCNFEDGTIGVKYATNRIGKFTKTITLSTNADKRPVILTIKGEVKSPPKDEGAMPVKKNEGSPLERN